MIEVKNLTFKYKKDSPEILRNLCLNIEKGEILSILGKNGIGKTTLLKCITREVVNYSGTILLDGVDIKSLSVGEFSKYIALVSANSLSYQNLSVADYLVTGFANQLATIHSPNKEHYKKANEVLSDMGKEEILNRNIYELSSGEMQLVKIARAIIQNPKIILFDEPTSNLDIKNQLLVLNQLSSLSEKGYTVITTTHNPGQPIELGGKVLMMSDKEYFFGNVHNTLTKEYLEKIYGLSVDFDEYKSRQIAIFEDKSTEHRLFY